MKNLTLILVVLVSCSKPQLTAEAGIEVGITAPELIIAPDLVIVKGSEYGPSIPGALSYLHEGDTTVTETSRLVRFFGFPANTPVHYVKTPCPVANEAKVLPGTSECDYMFVIPKNPTRYYPNMLRRELWVDGSVTTVYKEVYFYQVNCHPDYPDCDACEVPDTHQRIPVKGLDLYDEYDIVPKEKKWALIRTVNPGGIHGIEQDTTNNSVFIGDSSALVPIAPFNIRRVKNAYTWEGTGEWWEVDGVRVDSRLWTGRKPKAIASVNRYYSSQTQVKK